MKIAVVPGSFDPVTLGHLDIIKRASNVFDLVYVSILSNSGKHNPLFTIPERIELLKRVTKDIDNVVVDTFDGLLVDFVREKNAVAIVKGLRAVSDYEYELQMAALNKHIDHDIETVFLMADIQNSFLSSSIVKELARNGGKIKGLVPDKIIDDIMKKMY